MTTSELSSTVLKTVDAMDAAGFSRFFAEDAKMVFGNGDAMIGRPAIEAGVGGFFCSIEGLTHHVVNEWVVGNDSIIELRVAYDGLDGRHVEVPVVSIWTVGNDGLINDYRVFFDLAPLYAAA